MKIQAQPWKSRSDECIGDEATDVQKREKKNQGKICLMGEIIQLSLINLESRPQSDFDLQLNLQLDSKNIDVLILLTAMYDHSKHQLVKRKPENRFRRARIKFLH